MSDNDTIELVRHLRAMARCEHEDMTVVVDAAAEIERLRSRVEVLEAVLHAIFPDGANIKLVPKANAEEAKP